MNILYILSRCLQRFRRRPQIGQQIFLINSAQAGVYIPFDILRVSDFVAWSDVLGDIRSTLVVGSLIFRPLVWRRLSRALATKFLSDYKGCPNFLEGLLSNCERRPGKFASCLLLLLSRDEEGFFSIIPFSTTGFFV